MDTTRCVGCGKLIEEGSKAFRVATGKLTGGAFNEAKCWGEMHEPCFEGAVESPAMALAKIKKLAKQTTVVLGKKAKAT
jgi:hypothetical protein